MRTTIFEFHPITNTAFPKGFVNIAGWTNKEIIFFTEAEDQEMVVDYRIKRMIHHFGSSYLIYYLN